MNCSNVAYSAFVFAEKSSRPVRQRFVSFVLQVVPGRRDKAVGVVDDLDAAELVIVENAVNRGALNVDDLVVLAHDAPRSVSINEASPAKLEVLRKKLSVAVRGISADEFLPYEARSPACVQNSTPGVVPPRELTRATRGF